MIYHKNYENMNLYKIINTFSHKQRVSFALYCAKDVEHFTNDPRVIASNQIVEQWLNGDQTVDLIVARTNAWNAANAYAASAASAANAYAADAYAAYDAYDASDAKSWNLHHNDRTKRNVANNQFCQEYIQIAQNWLSYWTIPNFPKDEPDFPIFDYLQDFNLISSLLPKKEDYYYLNLNGFDIKHENEMELLKLIDTNHIKTILRRIINNDLSQELRK